jgi:ANTAR domain
VLSFRLFVVGESLGALNLYGEAPEALTQDSVAIGEILAQHAAVAMAGAAGEEHMQSALASRDIIGQAKGILMHRDNLTGLQAFAALTPRLPGNERRGARSFAVDDLPVAHQVTVWARRAQGGRLDWEPREPLCFGSGAISA